MRKQVFGRQFKRDKNERAALFKGLMSSLILSERIETTEQKAKAIKGSVEKLVTKVKKNGAKSKNSLYKDLTPAAIEKLLLDVAPRFANRAGGYTRILRVGKRVKDNAQMVLIEWTEKPVVQKLEINNQEEKKKSEKKDKSEKKEVKKEKTKKEPEKKKTQTRARKKPSSK